MARIPAGGALYPLENHTIEMDGQRSVTRISKRMAAIALVIVVIVGVGGLFIFFIFRIQTPVSLESALERFRAGNDSVASGRYQVEPSTPRGKKSETITRRTRGKKRAELVVRQSHTSSSNLGANAPSETRSEFFDMMPAEGVYTYFGEGEEGIFPWSRPFPTRVTYRTVIHEGRDTWLEHHFFSEQRESWTRHSTSETGRFVHHQRNLIKIGPHDEDKTLPFVPPIQALRFPPQPGATWSGKSTGTVRPSGEKYDASWTVNMLADEHWNIGGTRTRVLSYEFHVVLTGEFNGTVSVNYWIAPRYGLTVREEYHADAKLGPLTYRGRWWVQLRSLEPRT